MRQKKPQQDKNKKHKKNWKILILNDKKRTKNNKTERKPKKNE